MLENFNTLISSVGLGPFSPMYFPLPRGKRYFFCGTKVVEIKKRFPLGRSFLFFDAPT